MPAQEKLIGHWKSRLGSRPPLGAMDGKMIGRNPVDLVRQNNRRLKSLCENRSPPCHSEEPQSLP